MAHHVRMHVIHEQRLQAVHLRYNQERALSKVRIVPYCTVTKTGKEPLNNSIIVLISATHCGAHTLTKVSTELKTHSMGKATHPELRERTAKTLAQIEVSLNVLCDIDDHNTLFHVFKSILQKRRFSDVYLQTVPSIYSMKRATRYYTPG